jgi:hypothetical protein
MLFHGCAVIRALNCNGHGNNGWWNIQESCGRRECGQHCNWKCGTQNRPSQSYQTISRSQWINTSKYTSAGKHKYTSVVL